MIVILDNGGRYSEHEIRFIDVGLTPKDSVCVLLLRHAREHGLGGDAEPHVLGVVEAIEWRKPETLTLVKALWEQIDEHSCLVGRCRDVEFKALKPLASPYDVYYRDYKARETEIFARPWTPLECACSCASGELRDLLLGRCRCGKEVTYRTIDGLDSKLVCSDYPNCEVK